MDRRNNKLAAIIMLATLNIDNLALIESLEIDFSRRTNVVTGETGAGKSIIIGAVQLLLGQRADRSLVRAGADSCRISAVIELGNNITLLGEVNEQLEHAGVTPCNEGQLIIARTIAAKGGKCFVNSTPVALQLLADLGAVLVDVHGPYDHQSLLRPRKQLQVLDAFAGLAAQQQVCAERFEAVQHIDNQIADADADGPTPDKVEILKFQINEIRSANLEPDEDETLASRHARSANSKHILEILEAARHCMTDSDNAVVDQLAGLLRQMHELESIDATAGGTFVELLEQIVADLQTLTDEINSFAENVEIDPREFTAMEDRLGLLQRLKRKYGGSITEALAFADRIEEMLNRFENFAAWREELVQNRAAAEAEFLKHARALSRKRRRAATKLAKAITEKLCSLGFSDCGFEIVVEDAEPSTAGIDRVEFLFSPNPGEGTKPLRQIASSGEISRIMLAVKTVLASADRVPILIFDEIDANIGGSVAAQVGAELRGLGDEHQVICITHLPQVAAGGHRHFRVEKKVRNKRTTATLTALDDEARRLELARMLGDGGNSEVVLEHAAELISKTAR